MAFLFGSNGCISLSKIETSHINASPVNNNYYPDEIAIFVISENKACITPEQRSLINNWYKRYFSYNKGDKVNIYLQAQNNSSDILVAANLIVTMITYTLIPVYASSSLYIDIETFNGSSVKYQSAKVSGEALMSVLALPFLFTRPLFDVRRNNIENGFYRASLEPFSSESNSTKYTGLKPTADCRGLFEDFPEINRSAPQAW